MKHIDRKGLFLKRYDKILMGLIGLLLGLAFTSCEPDEPAPELWCSANVRSTFSSNGPTKTRLT